MGAIFAIQEVLGETSDSFAAALFFGPRDHANHLHKADDRAEDDSAKK